MLLTYWINHSDNTSSREPEHYCHKKNMSFAKAVKQRDNQSSTCQEMTFGNKKSTDIPINGEDICKNILLIHCY